MGDGPVAIALGVAIITVAILMTVIIIVCRIRWVHSVAEEPENGFFNSFSRHQSNTAIMEGSPGNFATRHDEQHDLESRFAPYHHSDGDEILMSQTSRSARPISRPTQDVHGDQSQDLRTF